VIVFILAPCDFLALTSIVITSPLNIVKYFYSFFIIFYYLFLKQKKRGVLVYLQSYGIAFSAKKLDLKIKTPTGLKAEKL
tara:strand:+ start:1635 stop:1874 length:240 start_codon:yes stop_codon:yes gene_type:complete